jgi:hypothetical protein
MAVGIGFYGADQVEPEKRQVGEVVPGKLFSVQVGVDQPETLEAGGGRPEAVKAWDHYLSVIADDDVIYLAVAADERPYLPVRLPGEFAKTPCEFMGQDPLRGKSPSVKLPQPFDLSRLETGGIAVYPVYFKLLLV